MACVWKRVYMFSQLIAVRGSAWETFLIISNSCLVMLVEQKLHTSPLTNKVKCKRHLSLFLHFKAGSLLQDLHYCIIFTYYCKWKSGQTYSSILIKQVFPSTASRGYFTVICYHVVLTVIIGFPFHPWFITATHYKKLFSNKYKNTHT